MDFSDFSWNYLDIVILIPLLWAAYKGFSKGLIVAVASLAALLIGIWGAYHFSDSTAFFLQEKFNFQSEYLPIISFTLTFILIVIGIHFLARLINRLVNAVSLSFVNRIFGLAFDVIKYLFIISVLLTLLQRFDTEEKLITPDLKSQSILFEPVAAFAPMIFPYIEFDKIKEKADEVEQKVDESIQKVKT